MRRTSRRATACRPSACSPSTLAANRMTVRKAIDKLVERGAARAQRHQRHARPAAARRAADRRALASLGITRIIRKRRHAGQQAAVFRRGTGDRASIAHRLDIAEGAELVMFRRLWTVDDMPFCIETSHLPAARVPGLVAEDLDRRPVALRAAARALRHRGRARERLIGVAIADRAPRRACCCSQPGVAALLLRLVAADANGMPIEYMASVNHPQSRRLSQTPTRRDDCRRTCARTRRQLVYPQRTQRCSDGAARRSGTDDEPAGARRRRHHRRRHHRHLHRAVPRPATASRWRCARRATSPASSRAATGAGAARWAATRARSRWHREPAPVAGDERAGRGARPASARPASSISAETRAEMARACEAWLEHARPYQLDTRLLSARRARRSCCPARRAASPARSTRRATAAPSRRRRRPRSPRAARRHGAACSRLRGARHRDRRPAASPPWSPRRAASPAPASCWPAAPGRGCSAAISASTCRSSRCSAR